MYFHFNKTAENNVTVSYWIESDVYEQPATTIIKIPVKGFCIFNKITKTITFDPEKSDSYFFQKRPWFHILYHLEQLDKAGQPFPQNYSFAIGG